MFNQIFFIKRRVSSAVASINNIKIVEVYGGGGGSGSTYKFSYVVLFNKNSVAFSLNGTSIQFAAAVGTIWSITNLSGTIPANGFFLVQEGSSGGTGSVLPISADVTGTIIMSRSGGKIAFLNTQIAASGCPVTAGNPNLVDFLGYGTANCFEGSGTGPASTGTNSTRRTNICVDTNNNAADFSSAVTNPRNSASVISVCP